jgi:DNA end-binding protein Ku
MECALMPPRAYWKGYLRLSLVSCPVQLFPATSEREKIRFHQINRKTRHRIKYCRLDAETGEQVAASDIVMGYEISKGEYIEVTRDEIEAIAMEGTHTVEIDEFVPRKEIDDLYLNHPYYVTPDGEVGQQAYAVIREAIRREGMVALGRVVLTTREHVIAIEAHGNGLLGITLRYPYEIRKESDYFGDVPNVKLSKDVLELAAHLVATKAGHFKPEGLEDRYERALRELIKRKRRGERIENRKERPSARVIDLMDALRKSAAAERGASRRQPRISSAARTRASVRPSTVQTRKGTVTRRGERLKPRRARDEASF